MKINTSVVADSIKLSLVRSLFNEAKEYDLVVISDEAGSRCLIKDGINGFTFTPTEVDELALKMRQSISIISKEDGGKRTNRMLERYQDSIGALVYHLNNI